MWVTFRGTRSRRLSVNTMLDAYELMCEDEVALGLYRSLYRLILGYRLCGFISISGQEYKDDVISRSKSTVIDFHDYWACIARARIGHCFVVVYVLLVYRACCMPTCTLRSRSDTANW